VLRVRCGGGVCALTSAVRALLLARMGVVSVLLAPLAGRMADRHHPHYLAGGGITGFSAALFWLAGALVPGAPIWQLVLPLVLVGAASAFVWAPIGSTATRNLPMAHAGGAAGVYNTTRQVGAGLGSARIAAILEARLAALLPGMTGDAE